MNIAAAIKELAACFYGSDVSGCKALLDRFPILLKSLGPRGTSWLHDIEKGTSLGLITMLHDRGLSVDVRNDYGESPLHSAAEVGRSDIVTYLLEQGADINAKTKWGANALVFACAAGHFETAKLLVENGIDIDIVYGSPTPKTVVERARLSGHEEIAKWLISIGAPEHPPQGAKKWKTDEDRLCEYLAPVYPDVKRNVISDVDNLIDIHAFRDADKTGPTTLVSTSGEDIEIGMIPPLGEDPELRHASLVIHLPSDWPLDRKALKKPENFWPLDRMEIIALLPALDKVWFGIAPLIVSNDDPPQPLSPSVGFTCTMLLKDASLMPFTTDYGKTVHFYTLVPLYTEERDYEKKHGFVALWKLFEDAGYGLTIDPNRPNLAK